MILVVDDDASTAAAIKAVLEHNGFSVITACSCDEALGLIDENRSQLIFSDITMPGHTGLEFLRLLKSNPDTAQIPLVFVSALGRQQDVDNGLLAGAAAYITKPLNPPELLEAVHALLPVN